MKLEDQVCSLELAKRLKKLGVNQISLFKWIKANHPTEKTCDAMVQHSGALEDSYEDTPVSDGWTLTSWAAFTVAELGEMLPDNIKDDDEEICWIYHDKINGCHRISYVHSCDEQCSPFIECKGETEANARAKMLIYLIEQGLMKP